MFKDSFFLVHKSSCGELYRLRLGRVKYHIYSNKRPGHLFSFGTLGVGAYLIFVIFNEDSFVLSNN